MQLIKIRFYLIFLMAGFDNGATSAIIKLFIKVDYSTKGGEYGKSY